MGINPQFYTRISRSQCSYVKLGKKSDISIKHPERVIRDVFGYRGSLHFDVSCMDETKRKLMLSIRLRKPECKPVISLEGVLKTIYSDVLIGYQP